MKPEIVLEHRFVTAIPEELEDRTVYVSIDFATVTHRCCCGCGREVVTPLTPTDWSLIFDGETISLNPSVGNWNLPCQSHYWIRRNRVHWALLWSREQIEAGHAADSQAKASYYGGEPPVAEQPQTSSPIPSAAGQPTEAALPGKKVQEERIWRRLVRWLFGS
jgi:Family of unknown function (DUF6527)